jgi:hypothetical protein
MTEPLTPEHFRPHLARIFRVQGDDRALTLTEVQVPALPESQLKILPRQPFSLIFQSPPAEVLPEGLYTFEVEGGPALEFYVMPIHTPARDRQDYQAVFN